MPDFTVTRTSAVQVGPSVVHNAQDLVNFVSSRFPGYAVAEYLRELNAVYIEELWTETKNLEASFFSNIVVLTTVLQSQDFDLMTNRDGALSAAADLRLVEINNLRVQLPGSSLRLPVLWRPRNHPDFAAIAALQPLAAYTIGPTVATLYNEGTLRFARPLPVGTTLEVDYVFDLLPLAIVSGGSMSSTGTAVTGVGTSFTQLVPADFVGTLPISATQQHTDFFAEMVVAGRQNQVAQITSDTALTTFNAISPAAAAGTPYVLATVPAFPRAFRYTIGTLALRNMFSTPGEDERFREWAALAQEAKDRFISAQLTRQGAMNQKKMRFPYGQVPRSFTYGIN